MCSVRHVAAAVHCEATITHFSDGKDVLGHAHIFFQKKCKAMAYGMMRWLNGIWPDIDGKAMTSLECTMPGRHNTFLTILFEKNELSAKV